MFKEMRRQDRALGQDEINTILDEGLYGVLSTSGVDQYAYGVPLSYARVDNVLYLHAALEGQKLAAIQKNNKVSFCVVGKVQTLPEKFSTQYESVIAFGTLTLLAGKEKEQALMALVDKYSPDFKKEGEMYIDKAQDKTAAMKLTIEHCTGKARR